MWRTPAATPRFRAAEANWPALHEIDGVVAVAPKRSRRQSQDESCVCFLHDPLEREGGYMVTLVDNHLAVVRHDVAYDTLAHEALHDCDVDDAVRRALASADYSDRSVIDAQKRGQAIAPLIEQLSPVNDDQRIGLPRGNHCGCNDRLAERRGGAQNTDFVFQHRINSQSLVGMQLALEHRVDRSTGMPLVFQLQRDTTVQQQGPHVVGTPAW